jgi:hypothetical protein
MKAILHAPILLVAFNRPEITKIVFDRISSLKPSTIYIALDGPREGNLNDIKLCNEVKSIVQNIDWPCKKEYRICEKNLGAEINISTAISWVLENEEYVIVLEDDILAPESFFVFVQEMLIRYQSDENIAMVSGCNYTPINLPNNEDYLFCISGHTWGWGTWRRAWKNFDLNVNIFDDVANDNQIKRISNSRIERKYYKKVLKRMQKKGLGNNTWDFCWYYQRIINNWFSIVPSRNLTSNIGIIGLHSKERTRNHFRLVDEKFEVNNHPKEVRCNLEYDKIHIKKHLNIEPPISKILINKIRLFFSHSIGS